MEGICDVYYEREIYLWDIAAGLSLVKEAGGFIFWVHREGWKFDVIATNRYLFEKVKKKKIFHMTNLKTTFLSFELNEKSPVYGGKDDKLKIKKSN